MLHLIEHTLKDCIGMLPFLFLAYLLMEWLEHRAGARAARVLERSGAVGPVLGGLLGVLPQCGFSASAAGLYAGRVISAGTLLAVFLSTSDEMLPILISHGVPAGRVIKILAVKIGIAVAAGLLFDLILRAAHWDRAAHDKRRHHGDKHEHEHHHAHGQDSDRHDHHHEHDHHDHAHEHHEHHEHAHGHENHHHDHGGERPQTAIRELCEDNHCHCERGIFRSALMHTGQIFLYILLITFAFNVLIHSVGEDTVGAWLSAVPGLGQAIAGLIGLIPNCAASVIITQMYLEGVISSGCMMAGLLVGAGIGVMVLFRVNRRRMRDNLWLVLVLYVIGVLAGVLIDACGLVF